MTSFIKHIVTELCFSPKNVCANDPLVKVYFMLIWLINTRQSFFLIVSPHKPVLNRDMEQMMPSHLSKAQFYASKLKWTFFWVFSSQFRKII